MKKLLILLVVALSGLVHADWKLNPYTQRQDYYEATGSLHVSTAALNARINAVAISTGANAAAIAAETAARVAGDAALALSTAPLKDYANWNTAYGWGDHAGKYLISPASFTYLNDASKFLVAPASFTYQSPGNYITSLTGNVTASGPGSVAATIVSVPQAAVNLSTVTTALAGKLDTNGSAASLTNFPTFNQNTTGNAATATKLATARAINGVDFDGSAAINISTTSYLADGVSLALTGATFSAKSSSVTLQGNTFNGASQLVRLDGSAKLPAVDGSALINLPSASGGGGAGLASTQTFTGANTFQSSVALSYGGSMRNSAFTLPTRHTVIAGTTTSAGYADFLNKTSGLFVHTYATAADPIVIAFAAGHNAYGPVDYIYGITASSTNAWAPAASTTTFLGVNLNATNNTITYVKTVHPLTYGYAAPSCNTDKFFFSIPKMKMYICSGGVWVSTNTIFVGEAVTDGSNVTTLRTYALNGKYISPPQGFSNTGVKMTNNHNIGVENVNWRLLFTNYTADNSWAPGQTWTRASGWYQGGLGSQVGWADRLTSEWMWDGTITMLGRGATGNTSQSWPNWLYQMIVERGF